MPTFDSSASGKMSADGIWDVLELDRRTLWKRALFKQARILRGDRLRSCKDIDDHKVLLHTHD